MTMETQDTHNAVSEYYGKTLQKSDDLKTNACKTGATMPKYIRKALGEVHDEVVMKYYGCGLTIPPLVEGTRVLDLGSGSGRDVYLLSKLVGSTGSVVGVDMTDEQLDVARKYVDYHTKQYGYDKPNVDFVKAYIEDMSVFEDNTFDLIVSNCVVNLAKDKDAVLKEAYRLLKPGGEFYFSDVYSDRRVPQSLVDDEVLYGECLSGALYVQDFVSKSKRAGFLDPRLVEDSRITVKNKKIEEKVGNIKFYSATYRLFKLPELDDNCEDYGQALMYKGTIAETPREFKLDDHHVFEAGKVYSVCRNSYLMINATRYRDQFEFYGAGTEHYGLFEGCGPTTPFKSAVADAPVAATSSCC